MVGDTIAAIATAPGTGAIGIVRISGPHAEGILNEIFSKQCVELRKLYYGEILHNGEAIDHVMAAFFREPNSYTGEDVAEIYAHGNPLILQKILAAAIAVGARHALPGEFSRRAFLHGKMDLARAEAVQALISAKSDTARRAGLRQLGGGLSTRISRLRDTILSWLAHIELSIDYPEHEEEAKNAAQILDEAAPLLREVNSLLASYSRGRVFTEGVKCAIIGRPNVGKSTLLNAILAEDRAITHDTPGTTRDVLQATVRIHDVPLILMDTAGLRETGDAIEKIGVQRTLTAAQDADLILYVTTTEDGITTEDAEMLEKLTHKKVLLIFNKCDKTVGAAHTRKGTRPLDPYDKNKIAHLRDFGSRDLSLVGCGATPHGLNISISSLTGVGLDLLYDAIAGLYVSGAIEADDADLIMGARHADLLEKTAAALDTATAQLATGQPEDLVSISLRSAYLSLGEILGEQVHDDIVDRIFSEFCVGK